MMNINDNNYELWLLRYAEHELTDDKRTEVEQWLASHPEAAEELALYNEAPRLERDEKVHSMQYPQKRSVPLWQPAVRWAAAAAVVLALMLPGLRSTTSPAPRMVAENTPQPLRSSELRLPHPENSELRTPHSPLSEVAIVEDVPMPIENTQEVVQPETAEDAQEMKNEEMKNEKGGWRDMEGLIYVDNLIVYDTVPEAEETPTEELAVADVKYIQSETSINPIGLFISTFIKANK